MSELAPLITDLGIILVVAGCVMILFKWLKQPVILGYIVAGFITGPSVSFLPTVSDTSDIKIWADIGVIFLLFAMGLEFSFRKLLNVGLSAMVATVTIVCGMMFLGYVAGNMMGFSHITSLFLGGMLSMSSTAIVFKAFNDMNLLQQKFTGIVLGILVVEDLVGVVMLVVLSTLAASSQFEGTALLGSLMKLVSFLVFWSVLGIYLLPTLINRIKRFVSDEILLVVSLGLCLLMVMIAVRAGFSSALGAFVMGSLLAETSESERISRVVQPVKDLFAAVFFVSVGMMIDPMVIRDYIVPILLLTLLVLAGQSFFGTFGVLLSGQPLKLAMKSGFSLTQVGRLYYCLVRCEPEGDRYTFVSHYCGSICHHYVLYTLYDTFFRACIPVCRPSFAGMGQAGFVALCFRFHIREAPERLAPSVAGNDSRRVGVSGSLHRRYSHILF